MKTRIYLFALAAVSLLVASCTEKIGTEPGNDTIPVVTVYNYAPSAEYDGDTDQRIRFVNNGKATQAFYLVDKTADKAAIIDAQGEEAYIRKVMSQGTAISFNSDGMFETTVTDMPGEYDISVVASDGSASTLRSVSFKGIAWNTASSISGTYKLHRASIQNLAGGSSFPALLQRHETDEKLFRIKGALGPGTKITIRLIDKTGTDEDGTYTYFRIPEQATPFTYNNYGTVSVRDIGYWQGDDAYVTDNGFESGMYADGTCFLCIQYYVSAGSLGYGYDYFIAD